MPDPLRYILIGTGGHGAHWCTSVLPRLKQIGKAVPVAAVDISADRLRNARQYLGLAPEHCFTSPVEAIEKRRADFVILVVPPSQHEKLIDMALTFDLDILTEGPIAETMEASIRVYRKMKEAQKKLAVAMSQRFDQEKQTLLELINSRKFGRLNYLVCRSTENARKSPSWGKFRHEMLDPLLIEAAHHHFDVLRALAGAEPRRVFTMAWNPPWGDYRGDSSALVTIEMENDVHCLWEGTKVSSATLNPMNQEYIRAECEHGTLELDRRRIRILSGGSVDLPNEEEVPLLDRPAWGTAVVAEQFCDWVRGGPEPANALSDHIRSSALTFAAIESAHTGKPIVVPDYLKEQVKATPAVAVKPLPFDEE